jgi:hypothetical protein
MLAGTALVGTKYLSKTGIPVKVVEIKGDKVVLFSEATQTNITVSKNYPLQEFEEQKVSTEAKALMKANGSDKSGKPGKPKGETLAAVIDPYLFAGGMSVEEIVKEIEKKKLPVANGKDLNANVRARMVCYSRKGWKIEKTEDKKVKVIKPGK